MERFALALVLRTTPALARMPDDAGPLLDIGLSLDSRYADAGDKALCLSAIFEETRAEVDAALRRVREGVGNDAEMGEAETLDAVAAVERSQAAWVAAVDARCTDEVAIVFRGGTRRSEASMRCYLAHDARRLAELSDLAP